MRHTIATASLLGLLLASAAGHAAESYAFGNRVLTVGEGVGKLVELAGSPAHKEPVENEEGARIGERWEYRLDGKTVLVTLGEGKVQRIDEIY
ncbi:MAG TPA: DUF2845 domain-containing protein [Lysobacter sp.]